MSQPRTTLFLGDLPAHCVENDIYGLFGQYGEIAEIKIMRSEENFRNLSYGFVKFVDPISAEKALVASEGLQLGGRHLKVGWASHKTKKETKNSSHKDKANSSSVHISYISYQLTNLINEDSLRKLFEKYGTVLDCAIKKSYIDENINRQCGYGFVHFSSDKEGITSALAAVAGLNDATLDNVCYKCSISHNLEKQLLEMQRTAQNAASFPVQPVVEDMKTPRPRIQQHAPINANYRVAPAVAPTMRIPTRTVEKDNSDSRFLLESSFAARQQQHQHLQHHPSQYHQQQQQHQQQQLAQVHVRPQQDFHSTSRPPRIVSATSMHGSVNGNQGQLSTSPSLLSGSSSSFDLALPSPSVSAKEVSFPPSATASSTSSSSNLFSSVSSIGLFDSFSFDAPSTPATTIGASSSSTSFFGDFPSHGFDSHASSAKSNHSMFSMKSLTSELSEMSSSFSSSPSTSQHQHHPHLAQSSQQHSQQQHSQQQQQHQHQQHHTGLGLLDHVFHFSSLRSSHHPTASESSNHSSRLPTPTAADVSSHHEKSSFFGVLSHRDHSHEEDHVLQKNHHQSHHQSQHPHHNHHSLFEFSLFDRPPFHRHHPAHSQAATPSLSSSPSLGSSLLSGSGEPLSLHHHHQHHHASSLDHSSSSGHNNGHRGMLSSLF